MKTLVPKSSGAYSVTTDAIPVQIEYKWHKYKYLNILNGFSTTGVSDYDILPRFWEISFTCAQGREEHCSFAKFRLKTKSYRTAFGKVIRLPELIWSYQNCITPSLSGKPCHKGRFFYRTALHRVYRDCVSYCLY